MKIKFKFIKKWIKIVAHEVKQLIKKTKEQNKRVNYLGVIN